MGRLQCTAPQTDGDGVGRTKLGRVGPEEYFGSAPRRSPGGLGERAQRAEVQCRASRRARVRLRDGGLCSGLTDLLREGTRGRPGPIRWRRAAANVGCVECMDLWRCFTPEMVVDLFRQGTVRRPLYSLTTDQ